MFTIEPVKPAQIDLMPLSILNARIEMLHKPKKSDLKAKEAKEETKVQTKQEGKGETVKSGHHRIVPQTIQSVTNDRYNVSHYS